MNTPTDPSSAHTAAESMFVAIVIPLFGRLPGLEKSLDSLAAQTRRPDLVVFLGDGRKSGVEALRENRTDLASEVLETGMNTLTSAINVSLQFLANYGYVSFLQAGDEYAPERIEQCLKKICKPVDSKLPGMVITGIEAKDSRGNTLPADDPRTKHLARIWAKADSGINLAEWLGLGDAVASLSNVFIRRETLVENPLPDDSPDYFPYFSVVSAAIQNQLAIIPKPLLRHTPTTDDLQITLSTTTNYLFAQLHLLETLRDKLEISPETRHNLTSFHRSNWNNLSGQREDLFQQTILRWASLARSEDIQNTARSILRMKAAEAPPAHIQDLTENEVPVDNAAYAAALARTRAQLNVTEHENKHLAAIADTARESGWIRFGSWLGERSSRRIFDLDENGLPEEEVE